MPQHTLLLRREIDQCNMSGRYKCLASSNLPHDTPRLTWQRVGAFSRQEADDNLQVTRMDHPRMVVPIETGSALATEKGKGQLA